MNTEERAELLPCPFCGGPASIRGDLGLQQLGCADPIGECPGSNIALPCYRPERRAESIKRWNRRAAQTHEAAPEQTGVPEGWRLVPVEPTPQMEMAARNHHSLTTHYEDHRISIWRAMLAAAPTPPAQASGQEQYAEARAVLTKENE